MLGPYVSASRHLVTDLPCRSAYVATSTPLASWRSQPLTTKHAALQRQTLTSPLVRVNFTASCARAATRGRSRIYFNLSDHHGLASKLTGRRPPSCASSPKEVSSAKLICREKSWLRSFEYAREFASRPRNQDTRRGRGAKLPRDINNLLSKIGTNDRAEISRARVYTPAE